MADQSSLQSKDYPYLYAHVLLIHWEDADEAFRGELNGLKRTFHEDFNFSTDTFSIPSEDPFRGLTIKLLEFLKHDDPNTLLVLYYGGHGSSNTDNHLIWRLQSTGDPCVDWTCLQQHVFGKKSDVLIILDCCSAASAIGERQKGRVEELMSCCIQGKTPATGDYCFTKKLSKILQDYSAKNGIEVYDLYHLLHQEYNKVGPDRREKGKDPVYLKPGKQLEKTIWLRRMDSFYTAKTSNPIGRRPGPRSVRTSRTVEVINMMERLDRGGFGDEGAPSFVSSATMYHSVLNGDGVLDWNTEGKAVLLELLEEPHLGDDYRGSPSPSEESSQTDQIIPPIERGAAKRPGDLEIQGTNPPPETVNQMDDTTSIDEDADFLQDNPSKDVPQHRRVINDLLSRIRTPLPALIFDSGSSGYGDAMSSVKQDDREIWNKKSFALLSNANNGVSAAQRLFRELRSIQTSGVQFISAAPLEDRLDTALASIEGPPDTPYEGGIFRISVEFNPTNAHDPPVLRFQTRVYHPNIDCNGEICADYQHWWDDQNLKRYMNFVANADTGAWFSQKTSNRYSLGALLTALCGLLASPNIQDPLVPEIAEKYIMDYAGYCEAAKLYTAKYAKAERPSAASITLTRDSFAKRNWNEYQTRSRSTTQSTITPTAGERTNGETASTGNWKPWERKISQELEINQEEAEGERNTLHFDAPALVPRLPPAKPGLSTPPQASSTSRSRSLTVGSQEGSPVVSDLLSHHSLSHHRNSQSQVFDISPSSSDSEGDTTQASSLKRGLMPLDIPPHVRDLKSRRLSEPIVTDDFGSFAFKNLSVLEKANKDVIQKLRAEAMASQNKQSAISPSGLNVTSPGPVLCRICERQISPWWFEKHTDLCMQEHQAEMDVQMAQKSLTDHRYAIIKVLDALEAGKSRSLQVSGEQPPIPIAEYKGFPIGPPPSTASSPGTLSSPTSSARSGERSTGFGRPGGRSFAVRRPYYRVVEGLLDLCDTALEISTPAIKESSTQAPRNFRTQSPQSEFRISQVTAWCFPSTNTLEQEPGLTLLCSDTERVSEAKVEAVLRHRRIIENAERIRIEYAVKV